MATNEIRKKSETKTPVKTDVKKSVAKSDQKSLIDIAEVRMVLYVVPVAICLAIFVYMNTHNYSLLYSILVPAGLAAILFTIVLRLFLTRKK